MFNFKEFFSFIVTWLTSMKWSFRRVIIVIAFFTVFPILQLFIWMGFILDNIFFRGYKSQKISQPIFITGNFRSGTTFLHRLLAKHPQFNSPHMWEILFAPSVFQRKTIKFLGYIFAKPFTYISSALEKDWHKKNVMHKVSLTEPEEDDYFLLHNWSALTTGLSAGLLDIASPYVKFDSELSEHNRSRIMRFYKACVQRHLYSHNTDQIYLTKNPALCPKLASVEHTFPDAKVIYIVRNPLEVIPSFLSMMNFSWDVVGTSTDRQKLKSFLIDMIYHWYIYPLSMIETLPHNRYAIVNYDDLVKQPDIVIQQTCSRLEIDIDSQYQNFLQQEANKAKGYRSQHEYSLEKLGLSEEEILSKFSHIMQRFNFKPNR